MIGKEEARRIIQARYDAMPGDEYASVSSAAYQNLHKMYEAYVADRKIATALLYTPLLKWREVALMQLKDDYPETIFDCVPTTKIPAMPTKKYDVIFVPLYGFTRNGYRLGHGSGWYDRFLPTQPQALTVGVGMEAGLIDFTVEPYDVAMGCIVTEKGVTWL